MTTDEGPDIEEPYCEIEKILRWRKIKRNEKFFKEYLVLWEGYPVEDATWVQAGQVSHPEQLKNYLKECNPQEGNI